jgi:hypothetical protein
MRVIRGAVGALSGVILIASILSILLGGNWHLGYGDDRILVAIFLVLIPAGLGVASPIWYWIGQPVWDWFDRPGDHLLRPFREVRLLPGLAGSVIGVALIFPVSATSRLLVQMLAPFGLAIAIGTPLWYWVVGPAGVVDTERWLPEVPTGSPLTTTAVQSLLVLGVLLGASEANTTVIAVTPANDSEGFFADLFGSSDDVPDEVREADDLRSATDAVRLAMNETDAAAENRTITQVVLATQNEKLVYSIQQFDPSGEPQEIIVAATGDGDDAVTTDPKRSRTLLARG